MPHAIAQAERFGTELILLRALEPPAEQVGSWKPAIKQAEEKTQALAREHLERVAAEVQERGIPVQTTIIEGRPHTKIAKYAEANQVDLIVMCTRGQSGPSRWLMGSVADRVVRGADVPVLLVRVRKKFVTLVFLALALSALGAHAQQARWQAEFFPNKTLGGPPVLTRSDQAINFDWGTGAPAAGVPADNFSARWTRAEWFDAGTYRFWSRSDDGFRLWVGDMVVFDNWFDQQGGWQTRDLSISPGYYKVRAEYYENAGGVLVVLNWERVSGGSRWSTLSKTGTPPSSSDSASAARPSNQRRLRLR